MKLIYYSLLLLCPLMGHTQVYLDEEPVKEYQFDDYIKQDSFYGYNPKVIHYVEYNSGSISLKYVYDLFANITHINPNTSNVTLNIYKPGAKKAKAFSYIDLFLNNNSFVVPTSWYKYYEDCFVEFFRGLKMQVQTSKISNKKHISFMDSENNVVFNIYFYRENDKHCIQILVNERDTIFEKQLLEENLAKN